MKGGTHNMMGNGSLRRLALALLVYWPLQGGGAEIVGRVRVQHAGLFAAAGPLAPGGISVSLVPLAGQALPRVATRNHRIEIRDQAFVPSYLTVQRGDELQFVSRDPVFHKLFSLSRVQPFGLDMDKVGSDGQPRASALYPLTETGPWHVFCRIHSRMYFRVDVVATPYYTMISDGGEFHFSGLAPGRWQVRVAAIGSEPLLVTAEAITAPPPLQIVLPVKGGSAPPLTNTVPGNAAEPSRHAHTETVGEN